MLKGVVITHLAVSGYGFVIQKVIHTYNMDAGNNAIALLSRRRIVADAAMVAGQR